MRFVLEGVSYAAVLSEKVCCLSAAPPPVRMPDLTGRRCRVVGSVESRASRRYAVSSASKHKSNPTPHPATEKPPDHASLSWRRLRVSERAFVY